MTKKTTYISPQTLCCRFSAEAMVCTSPADGTFDVDALDVDSEEGMGIDW